MANCPTGDPDVPGIDGYFLHVVPNTVAHGKADLIIKPPAAYVDLDVEVLVEGSWVVNRRACLAKYRSAHRSQRLGLWRGINRHEPCEQVERLIIETATVFVDDDLPAIFEIELSVRISEKVIDDRLGHRIGTDQGSVESAQAVRR